MGKRTLVRRRGRGGKQFRAIIVGKIAPAKYPNFKLDEHHSGTVVDIVHERGRDAPLARIHFDDNIYSYVPAPNGITVGRTIEGAGRKEKPFLKAGNRAKYMQAHGRLYPTVRGIAQAAVYHPHGGGRHQHIGRQSSVGRTTPPGRKVGNISPRKTGRSRLKERR